MVQDAQSPIANDKLKAAVTAFSELILKYPEKSRREILEEIELKFDLSPLDCEFLNRHFSSKDQVS